MWIRPVLIDFGLIQCSNEAVLQTGYFVTRKSDQENF